MEVMNTIKVLLIDDDEDEFILISRLLSSIPTQRYELDWRADQDLAQDTFSRSSFDICLLDYRLGQQKTGLDLLKVMAKTTPNLPVILLTGIGNHQIDLEAMRVGAADYLPKADLNPIILERSIRYSLQVARSKEALQRSNGELDARVRERTEELMIANEVLRGSESRFRLLSKTAARLLEADDPLEIVNELACEVMAELDCQAFFNFVVEDQVGRLRLNAYSGISAEEARDIEWLDYGVAICGCVARDGVRIVAEDIASNQEVRTDLVRSYGIKAYACHPLLSGSKLIGTLSFGTRTRSHFSVRDLDLMKTVADQVAVAIERKHLLETMGKSEQRLALTAHGARIGMFEWNITTGETFWNEQHARLLGLPTTTTTTIFTPYQYSDWAERVHPEDLSRIEKELHRCMSERVPYEAEYRTVWPDESVHWLAARGVYQYDEQGTPKYMRGIVMDITERKSAEEERERLLRDVEEQRGWLLAVLDALPVGVWMAEAGGKIVMVNNAASEIYGGKAPVVESIEEYSAYRVWWPDTGERIPAEDYPLPRALKGEAVKDMVMDFERFDHTRGTQTASSAPVRDSQGHILGGVVIALDITTLKQTEERLQESRDLLAKDLKAMTWLHKLGTLFVRDGNLEETLGQIVDAAISISDADFGSIQLLNEETYGLKIVAHRGFPQWWVDFWDEVTEGMWVCGTALERLERVSVENVEISPIFAGTPALEAQLRAGVRTMQSTPIISRSGKPLGMFSTHCKKPHLPDERTLPLLDMLARHAADIIERAHSEEELRRSRNALELRVTELKEKSENLEEVNIAMKVLLKQREGDQKELGETVLANVRTLVLPYLEKLKSTKMSSTQSTLLEILDTHLNEITSSFTRKLGVEAADLTPTEMRIAAFIRDGKSSAEIAGILCNSEKTVEGHRSNIRKKLGLQSRGSNLRSHLMKMA